MLKKELLSKDESNKEVWHFELSLKGSDMTYLPGDSIGVFPKNAHNVVELILNTLGFNGKELHSWQAEKPEPLSEILTHKADITSLTKSFLKKYKNFSKSTLLDEVLSMDRDETSEYLWGRQLYDAFAEFPPDKFTVENFLGLLRNIQPRLYSIASSQKKFTDEVHLLVASVRYERSGIERKGLCSTYLADMIEEGDEVPIYTQPNRNFKLPNDLTNPIIMIGPGTGLAPFRAFLQELATQNSGESWLFFGDQHEKSDFYYEDELKNYLQKGTLTKLDLAWSRDQNEKIYVQDKIKANAKEIYNWLENKNASIYVCGDAHKMAKDVHQTLLNIIEEYGGLNSADAEKKLKELQRQKRYQRDIY